MAVTFTLGIIDGATGAGSSRTTGSFTPAVGDLLLVQIAKSSSTNDGTVSDSLGTTYTLIQNVGFDAGGVHRLCVFIADALVTGAAMTVTYNCSGDDYGGIRWVVTRISGMTKVGSAACLQQDPNSGAAGATPSTIFAAACSTDNPTIGAVANRSNPAALTPPTGWTEISDGGVAAPIGM
jgi:hypothetical protein